MGPKQAGGIAVAKVTGTKGAAGERALLLRRAALLDRLALVASYDVQAQSRAIREAHVLMTFDVVHDTGRGAVPRIGHR